MAIRPAAAPPVSHVETACPLDCPDACTLRVSLRGGRITAIDGGSANPVTGEYICAKVRRFDQRVYGDDRLLYPAVRSGPKGRGVFRRVGWDDALALIAERLTEIRTRLGGEAILPLSYGGSNGFLTQDAADARLFRRLGASRLARTVCAAPTGAANETLYGRMPSVSYQDYPEARCIIVWGANPSVSGIHLMPYIKDARARGAFLAVIDPRATPLARQADLHLALRPGTDLALALAVHRWLWEHGHADEAFLAAHTVGADHLRARAEAWTLERAAEVTGVPAADIERLARTYADASPALVKCGWGLERSRNGGSAAMAVLALPAVAGKFGVRGGGYSMSQSASWGISKTWLRDPEPSTRVINMNRVGRALTAPEGTPIAALVVYNANPAVTLPDQQRVLAGLAREDLFTVVFDQVLTDTAAYADVVLPATTFLEHYDFAKAYGPMALQVVRPVIDQVGESRPNGDVFAELTDRLGLTQDGDGATELEQLLEVLGDLPPHIGEPLREQWSAVPPWDGRPVQFVDVHPQTADARVHLWSEARHAEAPAGLYGYQPDPGTEAFPLALISPATERTISSTLGELPRPDVLLEMHPTDARERALEEGDRARVFNALGEMHCRIRITPLVRPGTVAYPKGVWRRHALNGLTANALVPDTLTDLGGGACFNDARVQVARLADA